MLEICPGCAGGYPPSSGPTHPYIGASAGCWESYGRVLAREYGEFAYPEVHRLTVDAYAAQHPGVPGRRSIQSVAVHLIGLHVVLERGATAAAATRAMGVAIRAAVRRGGFEWLTPPASRGAIRIGDLLVARDLGEHERRVTRYASAVWESWSEHAPVIRRWASGE